MLDRSSAPIALDLLVEIAASRLGRRRQLSRAHAAISNAAFQPDGGSRAGRLCTTRKSCAAARRPVRDRPR